MVDQEEHQTMEGVLAAYPARPGEPDCVYYLNHGLCGYGLRCRFNHPHLPGNLCTDQVERQYPERVGQPDCQYYMKTGVCKFGAACKYHHPSGKLGSPVQLNLSGLPIRLGKGECMHYASTGSCKFHHPQPEERCSSAVSISSFPMSAYSLSSFCGITPTYVMARGSYIPGLTSYSPIVVSPHWAFKGPHSPTTPLDGIEQSPTANIKTARKVDSAIKYSKSRASSMYEEFPEREGQPECQYYLKTGDCRFGAFCKFHHPKGRTALASPPKRFLNVIGLPLRPVSTACVIRRACLLPLFCLL